MKVSFACEHCGQSLRVAARYAGRSSQCPACGQSVMVPIRDSNGEGGRDEPTGSFEQWEPKTVVRLDGGVRWRRIAIALLLLIPVVVVAALVIAPMFLPKDPREVVLRQYLAAVRADDQETIARLGVLEDPPVTHSVGGARQLVDRERTVTAPFAPVGQLHTFIDDKYEQMGQVYRKKDLTGMLAKTINMREQVEQQAREIFDPKLKPGQDPNEQLFDMAENYAKAWQSVTNLVVGGLEHDAMVVTYDQVVKAWGGRFDPAQEELVESFRSQPDQWKRLLGRDPRTIRADGDFSLSWSVWETDLWLQGQSWGEAPVRTEIVLVRFRLGLIDSGWKVWEIRTVD